MPHDLRSDALTPRGAQHPFRASRNFGLPVDAEQHSAVEPIHQCAPRVPERLLPALALAGAEPVERDREVVYSGARRVVHRVLQISRGCGRVAAQERRFDPALLIDLAPPAEPRVPVISGLRCMGRGVHGAHGEPAASRKRNPLRRRPCDVWSAAPTYRRGIPCETRTVPPTESTGCGSWRVPLAEPPDSADLRARPTMPMRRCW
jgi:hypothetical protein